jgi:hypothetical protein
MAVYAAGNCPFVRAADASLIGVAKGKELEQTGTGAPAPFGPTPYFFNAFADSNDGGLSSGSVQHLPSGSLLPLEADAGNLEYTAGFNTPGALDVAFPNGSYRIVLQTVHDGQRTLTLSLTGDAYPNDPHCSNYNAAQGVDPAASFTVNWDVFAGGTTADFVELKLKDDQGQTILDTPQPGQAGALNGTSTGYTIPVGTLAAGRTYSVRLLFAKVTSLDTSSYSGAPAVTAYTAETRFALLTIGGPDATAPTLVESIPSMGKTDVALNAAIVFTFSEPMQPGHSITWSGNVTAASFTYQWSSDKRSLFCIYASALPANTTIHWTLNPTGSSQSFRDLAGNRLAADVAGQFTTGFTNETGPDVQLIYVVKGESYSQSTSGVSQPEGATPFTAAGVAVGSRRGRLIGGVVKLPNSATVPLETPEDVGSLEMEVEREFASRAELDATAPNGNYVVTVQTVHEGSHSVALNVAGDAYPNVPHVTNFASTQAIDPSVDLTVTWDAFAGGTSGDFVQLAIDDDQRSAVFYSGLPGAANALDGTATSVRIPAGTLQPGRSYHAELLFTKIVSRDTTGYPGVPGFGGYIGITHLEFHTSGTRVADVQTYLLFKVEVFGQNGSGPPTPKGGTPYRVVANVFPSSPGFPPALSSVHSAGLHLPGGAVKAIPFSEPGEFFTLNEAFASEAALDAAYPAGNYTFDFSTAHDGFRTATLPMLATAYPNPVPHISNYAAAQAVDSTAAFKLTWDAWVGGVEGDTIQLNVLDLAGSVVFPPAHDPDAGTFNAALTSFTFNPNTLKPGSSYQCQLLFRHRTTVDTTSYSGAIGFVQFRRRTDFPMATVVAVPPRLVPLGFDGQGRFQIEIIGSGNLTVEGSSRLAPGSWLDAGAPVLTNGKWIYTDPDTALFDVRAYRALSK